MRLPKAPLVTDLERDFRIIWNYIAKVNTKDKQKAISILYTKNKISQKEYFNNCPLCEIHATIKGYSHTIFCGEDCIIKWLTNGCCNAYSLYQIWENTNNSGVRKKSAKAISNLPPNFRIAYKVVGKYNRLGTNWVSAFRSLLIKDPKKLPRKLQFLRRKFKESNLDHWTHRYQKGYFYQTPLDDQGFMCFENYESAKKFIKTFYRIKNLLKVIKVAGFGKPNYDIDIISRLGIWENLKALPSYPISSWKRYRFNDSVTYSNLLGVTYKTIQVLE